MTKQVFAQSALVTLALALVGTAQANHIGPAGCGLGNQVFKKDNQVLAATTNGSSYNQMFGITSGTSGCAEGGQMAQTVMFVESNRFALANDAARGNGQTVEALASLMGCSDSKAFGRALKSNYRQIFEASGENSIAITNSIKSTLGRDAALARACNTLG